MFMKIVLNVSKVRMNKQPILSIPYIYSRLNNVIFYVIFKYVIPAAKIIPKSE